MKITILILTLILAAMPSMRASSLALSDAEQKNPDLTAKDIAMICQWYIDSPVSDDKENVELHQSAAAAILMFASNSKDFTLDLGNEFSKLFDISSHTQGTSDLTITYLAAQTLYCIETEAKKNDERSYVFAVLAVLKYYQANKSYFGNFETLDKLLALPVDDRPAAIKSLYQKYTEHH